MKRFCLALFILPLYLAASAFSAEFRGAWVATVVNLNFPSRPGLTASEQQAEIIRILETAHTARINNLFVQVRPEADAIYDSPYEPWSRYLTGIQGLSPGYDPLKFFIDEGHRRGIAIHAWFNPYRAAMNVEEARDPRHVSYRYPHFVRRIGKMLWLDPGDPGVQNYVLNIIRDVVRRYDIDGVQIDDYFYPYPEFLHGREFPDSVTYEAYLHHGGSMSVADWRRASVNSLVRRMSEIVHEKPGLKFGVSPFGIYTRGEPADVVAGLDQFHQIYADPALWLRNGWVDYMAPQLYWRDLGPQSFSALLRWWRSPVMNPRGIPIYPGIALERLSEGTTWPVEEIARQLAAERTIQPRGKGGFILWNIKQLEQNRKGVLDVVISN